MIRAVFSIFGMALRVCSCTGPELVRFCVCVDRLRAR